MSKTDDAKAREIVDQFIVSDQRGLRARIVDALRTAHTAGVCDGVERAAKRCFKYGEECFNRLGVEVGIHQFNACRAAAGEIRALLPAGQAGASWLDARDALDRLYRVALRVEQSQSPMADEDLCGEYDDAMQQAGKTLGIDDELAHLRADQPEPGAGEA